MILTHVLGGQSY